LHKLSIGLIDTYNTINKRYYEKKKLKLVNNGWDDEHYDYKWKVGEWLADRYEVKGRIGKGSFGAVLRCWDHSEGGEVAVKIIKSKKAFMTQAQTEIKLLELLEKHGTADNQEQVVRMISQFEFRNHQCIVFEMLYCNLYELLKNTNFGGVSLQLTKKFARQILRTLQFLEQLPNPVIHCDLKPENVLLVEPRRSAIKVIDFGSACQSNEKMYTYIQSRFYRAPEVLLGLGYDTAIDMWSLGCMLVEMHTGEPLFAGRSSHDQMGKIVELKGLPPQDMIHKSPAKTRDAFFEHTVPTATTVAATTPCPTYKLRPVPIKSKKAKAHSNSTAGGAVAVEPTREVIPGERVLSHILGRDTGGPGGRRKDEANHNPADYDSFMDLLSGMLQYNPADRIKPVQALQHPFLRYSSSFVENGEAATPATASATGTGTGTSNPMSL